MMPQNLIFTNEVEQALVELLSRKDFNKLCIIADTNSKRCVLDQLHGRPLGSASLITIKPGEENKNIETLMQVWQQLGEAGCTRHSLVINMGGGMVTDLGGMAAATFKRGIPFINVPTTLLGAVDAAVGGKTGINFGALKNEIGCFKQATEVVISTKFFKTLPEQELKSGFAEMLKHALLSSDEDLEELLNFDLQGSSGDALLDVLKTSVLVKERIVEQDPQEQGTRRALNLGHTVGHAFESHALSQGKPIPHGYGVAWGLVTEMVLSHLLLKFPSRVLYRLARFVRENYKGHPITCDDYSALLDLMRHDKKSRGGEINCTLLKACGDCQIDNFIEDEDMKAALDIYRDLMHI